MKDLEYVKRFRVDKPEDFSLRGFNPTDTSGFDRSEAEAELLELVERLVDLQLRLYAEHSWAVLVILQGVDAAGKDSAIRHVMARFNPLGCNAHSFKMPEPHEIDHDFLWLAALRLPARGQVGVFNRSYYEEVLIVRVHRDLLANERLPTRLKRSGLSGLKTLTRSSVTSHGTAPQSLNFTFLSRRKSKSAAYWRG